MTLLLLIQMQSACGGIHNSNKYGGQCTLIQSCHYSCRPPVGSIFSAESSGHGTTPFGMRAYGRRGQSMKRLTWQWRRYKVTASSSMDKNTQSTGLNIFNVRWRLMDGLSGASAAAVLRERAAQDYRDAQKQAEALISRLQPTEIASSDLRSWYATRLHTTKSFSIREVLADRVPIGRGAFGEVFRGVNGLSGGEFAVKQIRLDKTGDVERARNTLHREIKTLELLSHV